MTETQKRIQAYKQALPGMKERVTAVALLLIMSVTMMISATFAWSTLSTAPEVNGLATTVATNGNLEIALSNQDGTEPDETTVSDGGQNVTKSNLTWGNLINLSDKSYGLADISLRPASLNIRSLATSPMYAVEYGVDGRVSGYLNDFAYTNYVVDEETGGMAFVPEDEIKYGVRAISTVTYGDFKGDAQLTRLLEEIDAALISAQGSFQKIYDTDPKVGGATATQYMSAVGGLVGVHVDYTLNGGTPDCQNYMENLYALAKDFLAGVKESGQIIVDAANLCLFNGNREKFNTSPYTLDDLINGTLTNAKLSEDCGKTIELVCLDYFRTLWKKMTGNDGVITQYSSLPGYSSAYANVQSNKNAVYGAYEVIETKYNQYKLNQQNGASTVVGYDQWMRMAIDLMCDMDTATIRAGNGKDYTPTELVQLKSDMNISALTPFMGDGPFYATIHEGAIKDLDQLLDCGMYVKSSDDIRIQATVSVKGISINIDMKPNIATSLDDSPFLSTDISTGKTVASGGSSYKGDAMAAETYAMVMDLWVRTNSQDSLLILEGDVILKEKRAFDAEGNDAGILYSCVLTDAETQEKVTQNVYKKDGVLYFDMTSDALTAEQTEEAQATLAVVYNEKPVGYEGVNRVWEELEDPNYRNELMIPDAGIVATQGSGSCYVFYPRSPEDQEQSLKLLSAMRVAFVDEEGKLLARAEMETSLAVEESGRVVVPLKLRANDPISVGDTTETFYITPLEQNVAKRITAIVYLEGGSLSNSDVLSAGSITGQLNIQFGTTDMTLDPAEDKEIMNDYYELSFTQKTFEFAEGLSEWIVNLELDVIGTKPTTVKGNFVSVINSTQGARQDEFELKYDQETKKWTAKVPFSGPGNYQLRSLKIDGVDYLLDEANIVKVTIPGLSVKSLGWGNQNYTGVPFVRTADTQHPELLNLELNSSDGQYHSVQGVFIGDSGQNVTVNFTSNDYTNYKGTATFSASGTYKMTYVYIDGVITALREDMYKEIGLQLGLKANIGYTSLTLIDPDPNNPLTDEEKAEILKMQSVAGASNCTYVYNGEAELTMKVWCTIQDDQDQFLVGLDNPVPQLYYNAGSVTNALDSNMVWNEDTDRYEGEFSLTNKYGVYTFKYLTVDEDNSITTAASSFTITAISPTPMEYVEDTTYNGQLIYNLELEPEDRVLTVALKGAPAAILRATVTDGSVDENGKTVYQTIEGVNAGEDANGISTFVFQLPSDGHWTMTGLKASNVFYNEQFYPGGEDEEGWLDLDATVQADQISAYYLTDVTVAVTGAPSEVNNGQFMTEHSYNSMTISVMNGSRPLSAAIAEVNDLYPDEAIGEVTVSMKYTWDEGASADYYSYPEGASLPAHDFVLTDADGDGDGVYTMPEMNFLLAGAYEPEFVLTVGDMVYSETAGNLNKVCKLESTMDALMNTVRVNWSKPTVTISNVTPGNGESFSANPTNSSSEEDNVITVSNAFTSTYATVYPQIVYGYLGYGDWTLPQVELHLGGITAEYTAANASITFTGGTTKYTNTFNFDTATDKAVSDIGKTMARTDALDGVPTTYVAGKQEIKQINVEYGDVVYQLDLANNGVTINNLLHPPYVDFASTGTDGTAFQAVPSRIYATVNDKGEFEVTLPTITSWDTDESQVLSTLPTSLAGLTPDSTTSSKQAINSWGTWTKYTVTTNVYTATASTKTWKETHTVENWTDGTNTYTPGDKITVSASKTLTAVTTSSPHSESSPTKTYKRTVVAVKNDGTQSGGWSVSGYTTVWSAPSASDSNWVEQ